MAKYGYKEGQGLGKKEQGMSTALQVECVHETKKRVMNDFNCIKCPKSHKYSLQVQKTSHRIGRIIHEKDNQREPSSFPNPMGLASSMAAYNDIVDDEAEEANNDNDGPTLTDLLKNPSKVVLLKVTMAVLCRMGKSCLPFSMDCVLCFVEYGWTWRGGR
jgi:splicing factor 45